MGPFRFQYWRWILFAGYCLIILWLLLFHRMSDEIQPWRYNLRPLDTVNRYLWVLHYGTDPVQRRYAAANLLGNVVLFVPLGIFLPRLFAVLRSFWRYFLLTVLLIVLLELTQAATGLGTFDVDDILLNLLGATLGWLLQFSITNLTSRA